MAAMNAANLFPKNDAIQQRTDEYYAEDNNERSARIDRMMIWLLAVEWLGMIGAALVISPRVWNGAASSVHPHVWAAVFAGPAFILPAIAIALLNPGRELTRHVIAVAQILVSALLIDCTGGRIETHFHVFGSLAFLALYRDWRVLITASALTAMDHIVRGVWWPESVYGVIAVSPWRWAEHAWWVVFEDFFLLISMRTSVREANQIAAHRASLYEGANHDVLTGLANRRLLQTLFDSGLGAGRRPSGAVLFIDLDRFKQANDTLGHTIGDKLLVMVSARLTEIVGSMGTLARVGGDEFVVLCEKASGLEDARLLGQQLLESLARPFHVEEHHLLLSASVGISLFPEHGTTLATLQECADRAMYLAKSRGRNQCIAFSPDVSDREDVVQQIDRDLSAAVDRQEFYLLFQPLVARNGQTAGFEALLRWKHPVHGTIPPADFIPLAEKSGLILKLGDWVLREACRTCRMWQRNFQSPVGIAVNVSPVQFEQPDYPEQVFSALAEAGMDASLLTLEITEGILVRNPARARAHLTRIRLAGVRIALDDFGTGYSSLSYLSELPADVIKLDRTFLNRDLPESAAIIESVVGLAHRLGLQVLAEGVETQEQSDGLMNLNCDQFQGYFFSRPMSANAVASLLESLEPVPALSTR
jgi:diguanylate cyclase (GGDEF)-like protein